MYSALVEVATYNNSNQDYTRLCAVNSGSETRVDIYFRADAPNSAEIYKMPDTLRKRFLSSAATHIPSATNFVQLRKMPKNQESIYINRC